MKSAIAAILLLATGLLAGCGGLGPRLIIDREPGATASKPQTEAAVPTRGGGYYKDDGPGDNPPDLGAVADAEPRREPLHRFANNPYNVFGVAYSPLRTIEPYQQRGLGSWYGRKFHGQRTSSGETYDMYGMTAAHPTLPIPSYARVTNVGNGKSVIVRVNDRGPFHPGRIIDLSYAAAWKLGYINSGSTSVELELITPEQMPLLAARRAPPAPVPAIAIAAERRTTPTATAVAQNAPAPINPPKPSVVQTTAIAAVEQPQAAPLPISAPAPTLPVEVETRGVFLQLAAFSVRDSAENFRARIYRELGWLNNGIEIFQKDGLFRLHAGPYKDRSEAGGMAERLRTELQLRPMIVVR